jgi:hypothetical protein
LIFLKLGWGSHICPLSYAVLRIRDADPDVYPSRIPDPQQHQKRRGKKFFCPTIFFSHKYKIVNNFIIEQVKIIFVAKTLRIVRIKLSKIWVWDPRSGIPDQEKKSIPDPGFWVKKAPDPGFDPENLCGSDAIPVRQH